MVETPPPSWADIPLEVAGLVLRRLPAHFDRVRFAAVCPQWRVASRDVPLPPPLPLLARPDGTVYSLPRSEPFRVPGCAGYTGACGNWLVFSREDGCFVRDPLSYATVTLPALSRIRVHYVGDEPVDEGKEVTAFKIVYCSPHLVAAIFHLKIRRTKQIAVCQPGPASWWSVRVEDWSPMLVDLVFHQGKLYALTIGVCTLFAIDICVDKSTGDPWVSQIQQVISVGDPGSYMFAHGFFILKMNYLVESRSTLLVVCRKVHLFKEGGRLKVKVVAADLIEFEVFEADIKRSQWTKVMTIGDDQVLFLSRWCSRSVCISQYKMPGDQIVFLENVDEDHCWYDEEIPSYCRVYNMRDDKVSTLLPTLSWKPDTVCDMALSLRTEVKLLLC
uniref:Uncharacterized protein n=1 Tax=Arundo donax TaxID=35708 RepID=A0A0A9HKD4_ARUDO